jgi:hypothetical protein
MSKICIGSVNHTHENLRQISLYLYSFAYSLLDYGILETEKV